MCSTIGVDRGFVFIASAKFPYLVPGPWDTSQQQVTTTVGGDATQWAARDAVDLP
jgi:hypothetical protein